MDFTFTEEQQMLLDSIRRLLADHYDLRQRNAVLTSKEGWSRELWNELGTLGLLAIGIPEAEGGAGDDPVTMMLACSAMGAGLVLEPFHSSAVVATTAIVRLGSAEQRSRWLPALASGELIAVLAHDEEGSPAYTVKLETNATKSGDGWDLNGKKSVVYHAPVADLLLVTAQLGEEIGVFAVPSGTSGLTLARYTCIDGQPAADVVLENVHVTAAERLGGDAREVLEAVRDQGLAALCADAFGAMERAFAATTAYTRSRVQFGASIASFQALRHRLAEMLMHVEQARSMLYLATCRCRDSDPEPRRLALAAAKALIGQAARYVGQQAVQLHGGIGMTDELNVSHYFRRLLAFELRHGTTSEHLEVYRRHLRAA